MAGKALQRVPCATRSFYISPQSIRRSIFQRPQLPQSTYIRRTASTQAQPDSQIDRPFVPAPKEGSGPLLTRQANRELPGLPDRKTWLKTLPIFVFLITVSALAIFNYQKSSSSTVNSILYALRTNEHVRALLGDEIYFASKVPWIRGELNQLHGHIDISFWVKGTKGQALTKFVSVRRRRNGFFETLEWSLKMEDGREIQLLEVEGARDPMQPLNKKIGAEESAEL